MTRKDVLRCVSLGILAFGVCGIFAVVSNASGQAPTGDEVWERLIQDAYSKHDAKMREILPPHSGLPPILDLSKSKAPDDPDGSAWYKWKGQLFVAGALTDPGLLTPSDATSTATTFLDGGGSYNLPARGCEVVAVARVVTADAHIDPAHSLVYSRFLLEICQTLKGQGKRGIRNRAKVPAVEFGGSIRFPSGHIASFIVAGRGFLELKEQYLVFMWRPIRSIDTYLISEAYLISDDHVFPITGVSDEQSYDGMPFEKFEAKVKAAIAKNIDAD